MSELCFITPTYRGDLEHFKLLRESIVAFGQGHIPHYALINTEDLPLLQQARLPGVIAKTTAELLPPEVEAQRVAYIHSGGRTWKRWQRSLNKRLGWFPNARYYGWQIQQLLKLAAPVQLPHRVFVSFDSDIVACGRFGAEDFTRDGKVALYEHRYQLQQRHRPGGWYGNACLLLDQPPPTQPGDEICEYVAQPFVFERKAMQALHQWLEQRYAMPWWQALVRQPLGDWSEFMTYGVFVRRHLDYAGAFVSKANANALWIENEAQRQDGAARIQRAFEDPAIQFLVIQADHHQRWPFSHFADMVRARLKQDAAPPITA